MISINIIINLRNGDPASFAREANARLVVLFEPALTMRAGEVSRGGSKVEWWKVNIVRTMQDMSSSFTDTHSYFSSQLDDVGVTDLSENKEEDLELQVESAEIMDINKRIKHQSR